MRDLVKWLDERLGSVVRLSDLLVSDLYLVDYLSGLSLNPSRSLLHHLSRSFTIFSKYWLIPGTDFGPDLVNRNASFKMEPKDIGIVQT